jgi:hypothetical protein
LSKWLVDYKTRTHNIPHYASIFEIMFAMFFKFRLYILATFLFAGSSQPIDDVPEPARKKNKGKKTHPKF